MERIQSASDFRPITVLSAVFRKEKRGEWVYALFEGSAPWESLKDFHLRRAREVAERLGGDLCSRDCCSRQLGAPGLKCNARWMLFRTLPPPWLLVLRCGAKLGLCLQPA